jgi:formate transporter
MSELFGFEAYSPREIARQVETLGVTKARLPLLSTLLLSILAGAFIGLGALFYVLITSDAIVLGFALSQVLGGLAFSLGLILVIVAGAELFTGNNLIVMAWADSQISWIEVLRNWGIVFVGNFVGAGGLAILVFLSHHPDMNNGAIASRYLELAIVKCTMTYEAAFFRGVLCNILVCMAVWMAIAGHSVTDKVLAVIFPVSAFVAAGFEHSIANMFIVPLAMLLQSSGDAKLIHDAVSWSIFLPRLAVVVAGNLSGGAVLVGLVYHIIYQRGRTASNSKR